MTTRFDSNIFVVFCTDFTQLKGGSHFAVQLVLLLRDFNVVLGSGLHRPTQVWIHVPAVREKVAGKEFGLIHSDLKLYVRAEKGYLAKHNGLSTIVG